MITLGCHSNLRPHEWCPSDHMSAATLAIANTALEAHRDTPQGETAGEGQLSARCLQGQGALAAARLSARPRQVRPLRFAHSSRQQRVTHLQPLRERLAKGGAPVVLAQPHRRTPHRKHGDAGDSGRTPSGATSRTRRTRSSSSATASFGYKLSGRLALESPSRRCSTATEWPGGF